MNANESLFPVNFEYSMTSLSVFYTFVELCSHLLDYLCGSSSALSPHSHDADDKILPYPCNLLSLLHLCLVMMGVVNEFQFHDSCGWLSPLALEPGGHTGHVPSASKYKFMICTPSSCHHIRLQNLTKMLLECRNFGGNASWG